MPSLWGGVEIRDRATNQNGPHKHKRPASEDLLEELGVLEEVLFVIFDGLDAFVATA